MKYFSKYYIRTKKNEPFDTEKNPIAFATPYENNSSFTKRKETVDLWAKGEYSYKEVDLHLYDNVPLEGYSFDRSVIRWFTNNKVFRMNDPRGFSFEISSENLADIILNGHIENGILKGKYVFARDKANNYLLSENHPDYANLIDTENPSKASDVSVGDVVILDDVEYVYFGKKWVSSVKFINHSYYNENGNIGYDVDFSISNHKKPFHIFVDENKKYVYCYVGFPKNFLLTNKKRENINFDDFNHYFNTHYYQKSLTFDTKHDMESYSWDLAKLNELAKSRKYRIRNKNINSNQ